MFKHKERCEKDIYITGFLRGGCKIEGAIVNFFFIYKLYHVTWYKWVYFLFFFILFWIGNILIHMAQNSKETKAWRVKSVLLMPSSRSSEFTWAISVLCIFSEIVHTSTEISVCLHDTKHSTLCVVTWQHYRGYTVSVGSGCCNRMPYTGWFKQHCPTGD